ncbi:MAG TPA: hypothetical protein VG895_04245 [Patescibacteria group bacterium]|nr:hypothetical protein [Patescibacteria group bacterium]
MQDFLKKNIITIIIVIATLVLAGIAVFTAIKLYQSRQTAVAPNAPVSEPHAATPAPACTALTFTIATPTPTASASPTPTVSPTPTPTPVPQCGTTCSTNSDCISGMACSGGVCRNPSCTDSTSCVCQTASPTPSPTPTSTATATPFIATASPTPAPQLPNSGTVEPTIIGIGAGAVLLVISLALVL